MTSSSRFEALITPILPDMTFAARSFTRQESDAMDLLQETLTRAFRSFDRFRPDTNLKAWLYTIMRNITIDASRRRKFEPVTFDEEPVEAARADVTVDWDRTLSDEMLRAVQKLTPRHRVLVFLCDIEGLSYQEIAGVLNVPIGTVMSGLHAARARLREYVAFELRLNK